MSMTAALLAAAAIPLGPAQSNAQAEFAVRDSFGGVVTGGALFYTSTPSGRAAVRRLDLSTGEITTVYTAPDRRTYVSGLAAGGGRVAFETEVWRRASAVFVTQADGGPVVQLGRGHAYDDGRCGRTFKLDDVSPSGEVLFEDARVACARRRGTFRVRAHDRESRTRTLVSRPAGHVFPSEGPPHRRLAGDHLLTFGDRVARVRNLASGALRRLRPLTRRSEFGAVDIASDGRVLLDEWRWRAERPEEVVRLVHSDGAGRAGAVVHRTQREFGEASFCGPHAVLYTITIRARLRLRLLDPSAPLVDGVLLEPDTKSGCDDYHFVVMLGAPRREDRVYVYTLPPR